MDITSDMIESITPDIYYQALRQYQSAQLLFEAIRLDIFTYLDQPATAGEIAGQISCDERNIELLLLALASCGYIAASERAYYNTRAGTAYLSRRSSCFIGHTILFREEMTSLADIGNKVKCGYKPNTGSGYDFAALAEVTVPEMYATGRADSFLAEVKSIFPDLEQEYKMLDLGGGNGILAIEFAGNYPNSRSCVFEAPEVSATTNRIIADHNLGHRVSVLTGDFNCDDIGRSYDLIVASGILDFASDNLDNFMGKMSAALTNNGYILLIGRYSETAGYPREHILSWLSGYMNGIKPPPTRAGVKAAMEKAGMIPIHTIQSGRFQGLLYKIVKAVE